MHMHTYTATRLHTGLCMCSHVHRDTGTHVHAHTCLRVHTSARGSSQLHPHPSAASPGGLSWFPVVAINNVQL